MLGLGLKVRQKAQTCKQTFKSMANQDNKNTVNIGKTLTTYNIEHTMSKFTRKVKNLAMESDHDLARTNFYFEPVLVTGGQTPVPQEKRRHPMLNI